MDRIHKGFYLYLHKGNNYFTFNSNFRDLLKVIISIKAGLGRTGSLIGAYIIKHYQMSAREVIAWMRICRPGSVIGQQQGWLEKIESWLWRQGNQFR